MNETKNKIEGFIDCILNEKDYQLLDILWILSYSIPSTSGYHKNRELFKKWFGTICMRNLQMKYNVKQKEVKEKMGIFVDFLNDLPDFLSKETFNEDDKLLREILINKSTNVVVYNVKSTLQNLSNLDKKILSFVLNIIPIRIQESLKEAERINQENPSLEEKYSFLFDFNVRTDKENGDITYFKIDTKEWTYIFNLLFDKELREHKYKPKSKGGKSRIIFFQSEQYDEYSFWQFGDELVKMGIGYWVFYVSAKGNISIDFIIPNFIYENIKSYKENLPIVENFIERLNEIKTDKGKAWHVEDFEEEAVNEILEAEIEDSIISNPELLEEGLELIGNQYVTSVGPIDVLCKDKDGNFVVIELKRDKGSHKVVGQIQKYMVWVNENLAKDRQTRGIIVVREHDIQLEYAIKGSKFPIEIKTFGKEPPTEENIKYCDRCGKPNKKSAKFCSKCGQEFWM